MKKRLSASVVLIACSACVAPAQLSNVGASKGEESTNCVDLWVVGADGRPVSNSHCVAYWLNAMCTDEPGAMSFAEHSTVLTPTAGAHFRIPRASPEGNLHSMLLFGAGFAPKWVDLDGQSLSPSEFGDITLGVVTLDCGGSASGRITNAVGAPVPNALIRWDTAGWEDAWTSIVGTWTDQNGNFVLHGIPEGHCSLVAVADGHPATVSEELPFVCDVTTKVDLVMRVGHTLRGLVLEQDRTPAVGAMVAVGKRSCFVDDAGGFRFDGLAGETQRLCVSTGLTLIAVEVDPRDPLLEVVLPARRQFRVRVRSGESGKPIEGALVEIQSLTLCGDASSKERARTSSLGWCSFVVGDGVDYVVSAENAVLATIVGGATEFLDFTTNR